MIPYDSASPVIGFDGDSWSNLCNSLLGSITVAVLMGAVAILLMTVMSHMTALGDHRRVNGAGTSNRGCRPESRMATVTYQFRGNWLDEIIR